MTQRNRCAISFIAFCFTAAFTMNGFLIHVWRLCDTICENDVCRYADCPSFADARSLLQRFFLPRLQIRINKLASGGIGYGIEIRLETTNDNVVQEIFVDVVERNATRRDLPYGDPRRVQVIGPPQGWKGIFWRWAEGRDVLRRVAYMTLRAVLESRGTKIAKEDARSFFTKEKIGRLDIAMNNAFGVKTRD